LIDEKFTDPAEWAAAAFATLLVVSQYPAGTTLTQDNIDALNDVLNTAPPATAAIGALLVLGLSTGMGPDAMAEVMAKSFGAKESK
jgi:hypothetical protein